MVRRPAAALAVLLVPSLAALTTPQLVVIDLDHTLWNRPRLKRGPPFTLVNHGLDGVHSACGKLINLCTLLPSLYDCECPTTVSNLAVQTLEHAMLSFTVTILAYQ